MSADEKAVIEYEVKLTARASQEIDEAIKKLEDVKATKQSTEQEEDDSSPDEDAETLLGADVDIRSDSEKLQEDIKKQIKDNIPKEIGDVADIALAPTLFIQKQIKSIFKSPKFAPFLTAVMTPIMAIILTLEISKALSVKGGPFNRDWRRFIQQEVAIGINRELQKLDELGELQTILRQGRGFTPNNINLTHNSLYEINETRIARIGLDDRSAGVRAI